MRSKQALLAQIILLTSGVLGALGTTWASSPPSFELSYQQSADGESESPRLKIRTSSGTVEIGDEEIAAEPLSSVDYRFFYMPNFLVDGHPAISYYAYPPDSRIKRNPMRVRWTEKGGLEMVEELADFTTDPPTYHPLLAWPIQCVKGRCHVATPHCVLKLPPSLYADAVSQLTDLLKSNGEAKKGSDSDRLIDLGYDVYLSALAGNSGASDLLGRMTGDSTFYHVANDLRGRYQWAAEHGCPVPKLPKHDD